MITFASTHYHNSYVFHIHTRVARATLRLCSNSNVMFYVLSERQSCTVFSEHSREERLLGSDLKRNGM